MAIIETRIVTCPLCHRTGLYLDVIEEQSAVIDKGDDQVWIDDDPRRFLVGATCVHEDCENECGPSQLDDLADSLGYIVAKRPDMDRLAQEARKELDYWTK